MAYFNGFPATYQPMGFQFQPVQQPVQTQNQQSGSMIWVQGEAGAKAYMVAPGQTVQLWDSEEKVIYLKSADASGMPSMKVLDYTIRGETQETPKEYATKDELKALADRIKSMESKRWKMKEEADDE